MKTMLSPTQVKLSSAIYDGYTVGVVENGHGDVTIYNPFLEENKAAALALKWDGNDPIIVESLVDELWEAVRIMLQNCILQFNVQDPEYGGVYETIRFHPLPENDMKYHAIHFVEYINKHYKLLDAINLEDAYAEFLLL